MSTIVRATGGIHVSEISGAIAYLAGQDSSPVTGSIIDGGCLAR